MQILKQDLNFYRKVFFQWNIHRSKEQSNIYKIFEIKCEKIRDEFIYNIQNE